MEEAKIQGMTPIPFETPPMRDFAEYSSFFKEQFDLDALVSTFRSKFIYSRSKGVDRVNGFQFKPLASDALAAASRKVFSGSYRFSPYLENLFVRGRGKVPRLISIPTVRDRVVLHQLKECLAHAFPECVPRNIASEHVRSLTAELANRQPDTTYICSCDIKDFYGSIDRTRLLKIVQTRVTHPLTISLIRRSLLTPIVPGNARRRDYKDYAEARGIPQGLATSNILAAIYLEEVDGAMNRLGIHYRRYVDDIIMFGDDAEIKKAHRSLVARLRYRKLGVHSLGSRKSQISRLSQPFGYLGYYFTWPTVTVRESTVERLLQSIAAKFSDYLHNTETRLLRLKYLTRDRLKEIFLDELNERISGAINEGRRYGWIAYFSQINDLSLLHKLDIVVAKMFGRVSDFEHKPPRGLKRFARAYYEMRFNPYGGYVRDYDKISTRAQKLAFLQERGRIFPDEELTEEQIHIRFEAYKRAVLSKMLADEGMIY